MTDEVAIVTGATGALGEATAAGLVALATSLQYEYVTGKFFKGQHAIQSSAFSLDSANQERLWALSSRLVGLAP